MKFLLFFCMCLFSLNAFSQVNADSCIEKDVVDILSKNRTPKSPDDRSSLILLPVIGTSPATGLFFGVGGSLGLYLGHPRTTNASQCSITLQYTTKKQFIFLFKSNLYTNENKWFLQNDLRFLVYSQDTYGLGTQIKDSASLNEEQIVWGEGLYPNNLAQPMNFNYIKIHQIVSKKIIDYVYVGAGYHLDKYSNIADQLLNVDKQQYTYHYNYSQQHGFNNEAYNISGISANMVIDKRDLMINPYKGYYLQANFRFNETWLGSSKSSTMLWLEARYYHPLSKKKPRHVLAFWAWANMAMGGDIPYLNLPAIGYDQKGFSGRGYVQGRFRGNQMLYSEVEWRFPISKCSNILGGVVFVNATTASDHDHAINLLQYIQPAFGLGLRILIDKTMRNNIAIDVARGNHSTGFYASAGEVF